MRGKANSGDEGSTESNQSMPGAASDERWQRKGETKLVGTSISWEEQVYLDPIRVVGTREIQLVDHNGGYARYL